MLWHLAEHAIVEGITCCTSTIIATNWPEKVSGKQQYILILKFDPGLAEMCLSLHALG